MTTSIHISRTRRGPAGGFAAALVGGTVPLDDETVSFETDQEMYPSGVATILAAASEAHVQAFGRPEPITTTEDQD